MDRQRAEAFIKALGIHYDKWTLYQAWAWHVWMECASANGWSFKETLAVANPEEVAP